MPINPEATGLKGEPKRRSWSSTDALLYAIGVGASTDELAFTTENTKDTPQQVLPTMAVILGGGGVPFDKIGTFNAALMLHGAQKIVIARALGVFVHLCDASGYIVHAVQVFVSGFCPRGCPLYIPLGR